MAGAFEKFMKKNKVGALIAMFVVIGVLVLLLSNFSNNYLENFQNILHVIKVKMMHGIIITFEHIRKFKICQFFFKNTVRDNHDSIDDYLDYQEKSDKCGGVVGLKNECFGRWVPGQIPTMIEDDYNWADTFGDMNKLTTTNILLFYLFSIKKPIIILYNMAGAFEIYEKNKVGALIAMFVFIGVLVLLLSNFSNNYLEKFEKTAKDLN